MTTDKQIPEARFSQVWHRDSAGKDRISEIAEKLAENVGDVSNKTEKRKAWGLWDWVINLIVFIIVQTAVSIIWLGVMEPAALSDPNVALESATKPEFLLVNAILMYIVWIGGMTWVTYRKGERSFKKDFKVAFKKWDALIGLGIAVLLYLIMALAQFVVVDLLKLDLAGADNGSMFTELKGFWFIIIAIGIASLMGPFAEELWFRGFLMNSILKTIQNRRDRLEHLKLSEKSAPLSWKAVKFFEKIRYPLAVIVSSAVFGAFHYQGSLDSFGYWFILFATGTLGMVFAIAALKFKRLGPSIFGHIFYNFSTLMLGVLLAT